ncbi:MAG TPA: 4-oxalomesaconate tautomerase [Vicinamibacterales bacterium]|nr:4-oxalomesaconate tautomerase [Vicinamibacterales bacterium]
MQTSIPCTMIRGGTSKGAYFLAPDLPVNTVARDRVLLAVMGSPDPRQIDGIGGADPLTSKVAIVSKSERPGIDVDYLFCQVWVDKAEVSTAQNCGNILAGVAPFAIERGLVRACDPITRVRIFMVNSSQTVVATVQTPGGQPDYQGEARIDGVPGTAAPIPLSFSDTAGSTCGSLLPTGHAVDVIHGVPVTCIDNGMPVVVMRAADVGRTGYESRDALDTDTELKTRIEAIRLEVGPMMNLGDVTHQTVPKMILVAPPRDGGLVATRSFIPHRAHATIGVFAALSVATACLLPESPAHTIARIPEGKTKQMLVEHPTGASPVSITTEEQNGAMVVTEAAIISTARPLFEGHVLIPQRVLGG